MGTDILGWIECKERWSKGWFGVISLEGIATRHYDMFGCLFGVRNNARFKPIAPDRGLPIDSSNAVRKAMAPRYNIEWNIIEDVADDPGIGGYTSITWQE